MLTNLLQFHQLASSNQHTILPVRLEGTVFWLSPSQDSLLLQTDAGAVLIDMDKPRASLSLGRQIVVEGNGQIQGAKLSLCRTLVVDNDGLHSTALASGATCLKAGRQPIRLAWFNGPTDMDLQVYYQGPELPLQRIPDAGLFHQVTDALNGNRRWVNGLEFRGYEGQWPQLPNFSQLPPVKTGTVANFDPRARSRDQHFGMEYQGFLELPRDGLYTFSIVSDDGSRLYIGESPERFTLIGTNTVGPPRRMGIAQVLGEGEDYQWAEVEGTVTFVAQNPPDTLLELEGDQARMIVRVLGAEPAALSRYGKKRILARGISVPIFNERGEKVAGELRVTGADALSLTQPTEEEWAGLKEYSMRVFATSRTGQPAKIVTRYALTSANDHPGRDPRNWRLLGSNDGGKTWIILDTRQDEAFENRFQRREFSLANLTAYNLYRLQIDGIQTPEEAMVQLAEIELNGAVDDVMEPESTTEKVAASLGEFPPTETKEKAFDGNPYTKWLHYATNSWIQAQYVWVNVPSNRAIKIHGRVREQQLGKSLVLEDGDARLRVRSPLGTAVARGTEIDAIGFLDREGSTPILASAYFQVRPSTAPTETMPPSASAKILTKAEQILRLSPHEQTANIPAKIRGAVTCYINDTEYGKNFKTVQDDTGGINLSWGWQFNGKPGDCVEVIGTIEPWAYAPMLRTRETKLLGKGQMPKPAHPSWDSLQNGKPENQWIELRGVVRSAKNDQFMLMVKGGQLPVRVFQAKTNSFASWIDATVVARGVYRIVFNKSFQMQSFMLESPGIEFVQVEKPAPPDPFGITLQVVTNLLRADPVEELPHRAKIAGVVTCTDRQFCFVQDDSGAMRVELKEEEPLKAGEKVEVVGFPEASVFLPRLTEVLIRKTGQAALPQPIHLTVQEVLKGEHDARRMRFEAVLLEQTDTGFNQVLELQAGLGVFRARLSNRNELVRSLRAGSRLELTGVYAGPDPGHATGPFELLINSAADIRVLSQPSWWTLRRLSIIIGALVGGLVIALVWITQLRRRVEERTAQLKKEIQERERAEHQRTVEEERSRIARDLHDDLGSSLTEISLLANAGSASLGLSEKTAGRFSTIADKSRSLVNALDVIVWAVDPNENRLQSFSDYLSGFAGEFLAASGLVCRFKIPVQFPATALDGQTRHGLFLAVKEALNNVVCHARATEVEFRMALVTDQLVITIKDNGCGFAVSAAPNGNGLTNLKHRLFKLGGHCIIESQPGSGATIVMSLPLPVDLPTL